MVVRGEVMVGGRGWGGMVVVKVGGVDTEMYRTGLCHAASINLSAFFAAAAVAARTPSGRGVAASGEGDHVKSGFTLNSGSAPLSGTDTVEWSQSAAQEGRFRGKSEDAAHLR